MYIKRNAERPVLNLIKNTQVTAIVGPRQCGKSTLAKKLLENIDGSLYLDLELPSDIRKLTDPEQFFRLNSDVLICIDEIQRLPDLFSIIRAVCDKTDRPGQFLILGSASPELLRQSSESLAGRISYFFLTPFLLDELGYENMHLHWLKGGFPKSWKAQNNELSLKWRNDFIFTYLEKDVKALGFTVNSQIIQRLWIMLAHSSGQILNRSKLSESLGVSVPTVTKYVEILEKTFMVRVLQPYYINVKKRLVKSPKVYIRDTGILHSLLDIETKNALMGNPVFGQSWETYASEQVISRFPGWKSWFYRTSDGSEIDLLLTRGNKSMAFEFKASLSPVPGRGFFNCLKDLGIKESYIVCPFLESERYLYNDLCEVISLNELGYSENAGEYNTDS